MLRILTAVVLLTGCWALPSHRKFTSIREIDDPKISPSESFEAFVAEQGFSVTRHDVETEDGYLLGMYHIPPLDHRAQAPVVLFQHGVLASMWCWVDNPTQSPPFELSKLGYDVWLSNSRGNTFSRNHTTLDVDSVAFWNFTFEDMALYDVPANVAFVLNATGASSLAFVGWSQGTTQFFISAQSGYRGEWLKSRVSVFAALSPVTYLKHSTSVLLVTAAKLGLAELLMRVYPKGFLAGSEMLSYVEVFLCKATLGLVCKLSAATVCGVSSLDDPEVLENIVAHFPDGTSVKDMEHYSQFIEQQFFGRYNYGADQNMIRYNSTTPPAYNLTSLSPIPIALFAASNDDLVAHDDFEVLLSQLPQGSVTFQKLYQGFSHVTWQAGNKDAWYWFDDLKAVLGVHARY